MPSLAEWLFRHTFVGCVSLQAASQSYNKFPSLQQIFHKIFTLSLKLSPFLTTAPHTLSTIKLQKSVHIAIDGTLSFANLQLLLLREEEHGPAVLHVV